MIGSDHQRPGPAGELSRVAGVIADTPLADGDMWAGDTLVRYLTVAGHGLNDLRLSVAIRPHPENPVRYEAECSACGASDWRDIYIVPVAYEPDQLRQWAQRHAETCRAVPRPAGRGES